jgi:putative membrane protein
MTHDHHFTIGSFLISATLFLIGLVYLRQWMRVAWLVPDAVKSWRVGGFLVGLLLVWVGLCSPLSFLDHDLLTLHMVQHLLLMTLAPPLILLGAIWKVLPQRREQRPLEPIARRHGGPIGQVGRMLLHPVVGWIGATATLVVWHIPGAFLLGLRSEMWHGIEQASFLVTGLLFWWPVVEPSRIAMKWPESSILLYLFLATLPCDILSGFLVFCDRVVYPAYLSSPRLFGLTALEDQQCAGALMWTCVTVVYLIAGAIVTARLLSPHSSQEYAILQSQTQAIGLPKSDVQRMEVV